MKNVKFETIHDQKFRLNNKSASRKRTTYKSFLFRRFEGYNEQVMEPTTVWLQSRMKMLKRRLTELPGCRPKTTHRHEESIKTMTLTTDKGNHSGNTECLFFQIQLQRLKCNFQ